MAEAELVWKDPPPKRRGQLGYWEEILVPLVKNPGRWARIAVERSTQKASFTTGNLNSRKVAIPQPDHDWSFVSRGREVFGIYRGRKPRARVRRTQRKG